jgi:eukaryotic translation initiation factor 2C
LIPIDIDRVFLKGVTAINPSTLPSRLNMELIKKLQMEVAADIFTPPAVFDGRKNMFAARELPLGSTYAKKVCNQFLSP